MGFCWSKQSLETHVDYMPITHTPQTLSVISEVNQETETFTEMEPPHI